MNQIGEYMKSFAGSDTLAIVTLLVFFAFFVILVWHSMTIRRNKIKEYGRMPLDEDVQDDHPNEESSK